MIQLTTPPTTLDADSEFHLREIERRSENAAERTTLLVRLYFAGFLTAASGLSYLAGRPLEEITQQQLTIAIYFLYCAGTYVFLGRARKYHPIVKYISSFVDISLLTFLTWYITTSQANPILSYFTPMTLIFFIFLVMSAVRNRPGVIVFTLILALLGHGGLMFLAYPEMRELNANLARLTPQLIPELAAAGETFNLPSGQPIGAALRLIYLSAVGGLLMYTIHIARRTAREQTAYLLAQKSLQFAEIDRLKTEFFLNMSHEFRTPLTLMLGPIERLLEQDAPAPERDRLLQLARRNAYHMLSNVNNLLDYSRIAAGKLQPMLRPVTLAALIATTTEAFHYEIERKGLRLHLETSEPCPQATIDPDLIERAVTNLLANALRFTNTGTISVRMRYAPGRFIICVADTGQGIAPDQRVAIFNRFHSTDAATGAGTGLGLPLAREIVELHGGSVRVRSRINAGSCFRIRLPAQSRDVADPAPRHRVLQPIVARPEAAAATITRATTTQYETLSANPTAEILLVEDNPDMREFLTETLQPFYYVSAVTNGHEALDYLRRRTPNLVISDVMMPEMDGLTLLRILRTEHSRRTLPVLMLTARSEPLDRIDGLRTGADDYLAKPFATGELLERARKLIERERATDAALARERAEIYANLHDNLGAQLTDLALQARHIHSATPPSEARERFQAAVTRAHQSLRTALSDSEDLERMREDFLLGLQLFLVRRYTNAGRRLHWRVNVACESLFSEERVPERIKHTLFAILRETSTNDLKYGAGPTELELDAAQSEVDARHILRLRFHARSTFRPGASTDVGGTGWGEKTIAARVAGINGVSSRSLTDGQFILTLEIPIDATTS